MQDPREPPTGLLEELKRRHVVRVGLTYVGAAVVLLEAAELVFDALEVSPEALRVLVLLALAGFPVALLLGWLFDVTPDGVRRTTRAGLGPVVARMRPRTLAGGLLGVLLLGLASVVAINRPRTAAAEVAAGADLIAVLPFSTQGQGVEVLGQGMVDLLSRNLDQVGAIRTVDSRTVLHRWERSGGRERVLTREDQLVIAREAAAGSVLTGNVFEANQQVRVDARLLAVDGATLASVRVDGSSADLLGLVDSLSLALVRELWRSEQPLPRLNVSAISSGDLEAIRAFLDGERFYRASAWDSALVAFQRAVAEDSMFTLAHFRLAATAGWIGYNDLARPGIEAALRRVDRLPAREQTLVRAEGLRRTGNTAAAIDTMSAYVERYPDDPEGWYLMADDLYHLRGDENAGLTARSADEVLWMFDKAITLDPSFAPALIHPLEIAFQRADLAQIRRLVGLVDGVPTTDTAATRIYRDALALLAGDGGADEAVLLLQRVAVGQSGGMDLSRQAAQAVRHPVLRDLAFWPAAERERVVDGLREGGWPGSAFAVPLLVAGGRVEEARALLDTPAVRGRMSARERRSLSLIGVLVGHAGVESLPADVALDPATRAAVELIAAVDRADAAGVRAVGRKARELPAAESREGEMLTRAAAGFARVLEGDTVGGLRDVERALEAARFIAGSDVEALWYRWLEGMASHPATRPRVRDLLQRPWPGSAAYEPQRQYIAARALEAEGRGAEAREAYARFLTAFSDADADLPAPRRARLAQAAGQGAARTN